MKRTLTRLVVLLILPAAAAFGQHDNCDKTRSEQGDLFIDCNSDGRADVLVAKMFGASAEYNISKMDPKVQKLVLTRAKKAKAKAKRLRGR